MLQRGQPRDELIATVAILRANALTPERLSAVLDHYGSAVELLPPEVGGRLTERSEMLLDAVQAETVTAAEKEVGIWEDLGLDVRTVLHESYPVNLQTVFDKPPILFIHGTWDEARDSRAVAVVGTRSASPDGLKRAFRLGKQLAERGVTVISGLAKGIDARAHQGALQGGGRTVAVMGTGIRRRYPAENEALAADIVRRGGALISQFFPDQPPTRWTFPKRNVTMSGLALATVVVEAGATSGAKLQAEAALRHGRAVFLPSSLLESHEWARHMVEEGFKGARAAEVHSTDELVQHLDLASADLPVLSG